MSCSPPTGTTPSSPTAAWGSSRPTNVTANTHLVEQVIAELQGNALARPPSGKYTANAAWVALAVTAFNLARATGVAASMHLSRWASLRKKISNVPARIATTARRLDLHLPADWPWAAGWESLWATATVPPAAITTSPPSRRRPTEDLKWKRRHRPADQPRSEDELRQHAAAVPEPQSARWIGDEA